MPPLIKHVNAQCRTTNEQQVRSRTRAAMVTVGWLGRVGGLGITMDNATELALYVHWVVLEARAKASAVARSGSREARRIGGPT